MKKLLVLYDGDFEDAGRDSYLKAIERNIINVEFRDIKGDFEEFIVGIDKLMLLQPTEDYVTKKMKEFLKENPQMDVEGVATDKITITAEAILNKIYEKAGYDLADKTIAVINQSNVLGKSLAKALIELGVNVISINSKYVDLENLLAFTNVDILISATGNNNFKLDEFLTRKVSVKIDLSDDLMDQEKIISVPTVEVLKNRLA